MFTSDVEKPFYSNAKGSNDTQSIKGVCNAAIKPPTLTYATHYLTGSPSAWTVSTSDPGETVNLDGIVVPITTMVNYEDLDAAGDSYDYLRVKVEVAYRANQDAKVRQEVFIEP